MKAIFCATKDGRLWHIKKDSQTYCGQQEIGLFTDPIELPEDKELVCQQCLKIFKEEQKP